MKKRRAPEKPRQSPRGLDRWRRAAVTVAAVYPGNRLVTRGSGAVLAVRGDGTRALIATCAHVAEPLLFDDNEAGGAVPVVIFYGEMTATDGPEGIGVTLRSQPIKVLRAWAHPKWVSVAETPREDVAILDIVGSRMQRIWFQKAAGLPARGTELVMFGYPSIGDVPALRITAGFYGELGPKGLAMADLSGFPGDSGGPVVNLATGELVGIYAGGDEHRDGISSIARSWFIPTAVIDECGDGEGGKYFGGAP